MRAVVIGAGVIGASIVYRLAQTGVDVVVLESNYVGAGTSGASFAWTNSNRKTPRAYHDLNVAGMALHSALVEEFNQATWLRVTGNIEWTTSDKARQAQRERVERLRSWGYKAEWIDIKQVKELEPDLSPDSIGESQIAYFPDEGLVDPVVYAGEMIGRSIRLGGARLELGRRVIGLEMRSNRVTAALLQDGSRIEADVFVNCAGCWVNEVVGKARGLEIPMAPTAGLLVFTPPAPARVRRPIHAPDVNLRPDGAGRLMLRSDDCDLRIASRTAPDVNLPAVKQIMDAARQALPVLGNMAAEAVRIGIRPIPADDLSAVGPIPGVEGYYLCVTHSGVTLAPVFGKAVADELVGRKGTHDLGPFRPARFFANAVA